MAAKNTSVSARVKKRAKLTEQLKKYEQQLQELNQQEAEAMFKVAQSFGIQDAEELKRIIKLGMEQQQAVQE